MIKEKSLVEEFEPTFSFASEMANECKWNRIKKLATAYWGSVDMATAFCYLPPPHFCGRGKSENSCPAADFYEKRKLAPFSIFRAI